MACHLFGAKPLPEPMLTYCEMYPKKQTSVKCESKYKTFLFIHENEFENIVCKILAILSRGRQVKHQAITWTNTDLSSTGLVGTNFSKVLIKIQTIFIQENVFETIIWILLVNEIF